jgi:hypothetical protein
MARPQKSTLDPAILGAALEGLENQKKRLEEQIASVRAMLGGRNYSAPSASSAVAESSSSRRKRNLSPEARERIAAAQKKRWAAYRKTKN